jgi:pimeloyl-ACP methyl ester carboxylesterase
VISELRSSRTADRCADAFNRDEHAINVLAIMLHDDGCIGAETLDGMEKLFPRGLKIELVPGAGHFVHQARPEHINDPR